MLLSSGIYYNHPTRAIRKKKPAKKYDVVNVRYYFQGLSPRIKNIDTEQNIYT